MAGTGEVRGSARWAGLQTSDPEGEGSGPAKSASTGSSLPFLRSDPKPAAIITQADKMTPHLPTETLSQVLALINLDQPAIARQLNRQRFALVCRNWFNAVDRWSEVVVVGVDRLNKLRDEVKADKKAANREREVGPRVKSLVVRVESGGRMGPALGSVLERVPDLERVEVLASAVTLKTLGKALSSKLGTLSKLREFELKGTTIASEHLPLHVFELTPCSTRELPRVDLLYSVVRADLCLTGRYSSRSP